MHYRLKLLMATCALALVSAGIVFALLYRTAERAQFAQIQSTVKAIAVATADLVDGDQHAQITGGEDVSYRDIERVLRRARDLHREAHVDVAFIYTMKPGPDGKWIYVVDAEEEGSRKSSYGDPFVFEANSEIDLVFNLDAPARADDGFTRDQYGYWLSAGAPIRDGSGKIVARLGVDLRADDVKAKQAVLFRRALGGLAVALVAGIALALWIGNWGSGPLHRIGVALGKIGDGELETRIEVKSADEFGRLEQAVNTMAESLQQRRALKGSLSRYVSRDVAHDMVKIEGEPEFVADAETQRISVMFCNIDDFEKLDDMLSDEQVVEVLNAFFGRAVSAVFDNGGTLDRFFGAGLMATFGSYQHDRKHEKEAIAAAKAVASAMGSISGLLPDGVEMSVRIGVHAGEAQVGRKGDNGDGRMAFKAVGGAVDVAAMVMAKASALEKPILATAETVEAAGGGEQTEPAGSIEVGDAQLELVSIG